MEVFLYEKDLIYILNCINYTKYKLIYHSTLEEKREIENYYNLFLFNEYYNDLNILHHKLSLAGNKAFYNKFDDIFFLGQRKFLCSKEKDFNFLKHNKCVSFKNKKCKRNNFFNFFIDKYKRIV